MRSEKRSLFELLFEFVAPHKKVDAEADCACCLDIVWKIVDVEDFVGMDFQELDDHIENSAFWFK